jgi:phytanoyl-CoA hydroxylase
MLTAQQVAHYREQGYVLVSGIFTTDELDRLEREFDGVLERRAAARAELNIVWGGDWKEKFRADQVVAHTHDVQAYSAEWTKVLTHDRFTHALSDCMGTPNVQLHHTKAFRKPSEKGAAFPMHQDKPYFPHERDTMMAGIIHLTDATEEMGCVRVYPGSHKLGDLPLAMDENGQPRGLYLEPEQWPIEKATLCEARRGDVLFFTYQTVHGSGLNVSPRVRKTVLVQVRDPLDKPVKDVHRSHAQGMMMRGIDPLTNRSTAVGALDEPRPKAVEV